MTGTLKTNLGIIHLSDEQSLEGSIGTTVDLLRSQSSTQSVVARGVARFAVIGNSPFKRGWLCVKILQDQRPLSVSRIISAAVPVSLSSLNARCQASSIPFTAARQMDPARLVSSTIATLRAMKDWWTFKDLAWLNSAREDCVALSYWLCANLPLGDDMRLRLLQINCPNIRLHETRSILSTFLDKSFSCRECGAVVSNTRDVFSTSVEGVVGTFVNPYGVVHQLVTVKTVAESVELTRMTDTRDSWFPGYRWTCVRCLTCHEHLGWRFDWVAKGLPSFPRQFWGISRTAIVLPNAAPPLAQ